MTTETKPEMPDVIYLQLDTQGGKEFHTWADHEIHEDDTKYIRADLCEQSPAPVHGDDKPLEGLDNDVVQGALTNLVNERLLVSDQRIAVSRIVRDYLKRADLQSQPDMRLVDALKRAQSIFKSMAHDYMATENMDEEHCDFHGLDRDEFLEMAYENLQADAVGGLRVCREALAPYAPDDGEAK